MGCTLKNCKNTTEKTGPAAVSIGINQRIVDAQSGGGKKRGVKEGVKKKNVVFEVKNYPGNCQQRVLQKTRQENDHRRKRGLSKRGNPGRNTQDITEKLAGEGQVRTKKKKQT